MAEPNKSDAGSAEREGARDTDAEPKGGRSDSVEAWGRMLGRTLGWIAVAYFLFFLLRSFGS